MKVINKIFLGISIGFILLGMSSCLKNGPYYTNYAGVAASIDLPLSAPGVVSGYPGNYPVSFAYNSSNLMVTETYGGIVTSFPYTSNGANNFTYPVYINVASPSVLGTTVTATLAIDTAYFNQFNAANGGGFVLMPDSVYTVSSWNLTVPAKQRLDSMQITFNYSKLEGNLKS